VTSGGTETSCIIIGATRYEGEQAAEIRRYIADEKNKWFIEMKAR
jgi:hypothetical protein